MREKIATVPAIPRSVEMIETMTYGIVFMSTSPFRSILEETQRILLHSALLESVLQSTEAELAAAVVVPATLLIVILLLVVAQADGVTFAASAASAFAHCIPHCPPFFPMISWAFIGLLAAKAFAASETAPLLFISLL
jgi:hypothetical protein